MLTAAVAEVTRRGSHDPGALAIVCERHRRALQRSMPVAVVFGDHVQIATSSRTISEATMSDPIVEGLRRIGIRSSRDTLVALLAHATKSRLSATEVVEQLVALELRERDARNLVRRTRAATLGPPWLPSTLLIGTIPAPSTATSTISCSASNS